MGNLFKANISFAENTAHTTNSSSMKLLTIESHVSYYSYSCIRNDGQFKVIYSHDVTPVPTVIHKQVLKSQW